jgi:hypothetical protein
LWKVIGVLTGSGAMMSVGTIMMRYLGCLP